MARRFDAAQAQAITDFVITVVLFSRRMSSWGGFKPLFGFDDLSPSHSTQDHLRCTRSWKSADPIFQYLNRLRRKGGSAGSSAIREVIWTNGYKARREPECWGDSRMVLPRCSGTMLGRGHAYLIGVALNDVVRRNQQNRDYEAQRIYVNGFEPGTDVWLLICGHGTKPTRTPEFASAPFLQGKRSVLMLSHDVDWEYSFKPMFDFRRVRKKRGHFQHIFCSDQISG